MTLKGLDDSKVEPEQSRHGYIVVKVVPLSVFRLLFGGASCLRLEMPSETTIYTLLNRLLDQHQEEFEKRFPHVTPNQLINSAVLFLNDRHPRNGLDTRLNDGDTLVIAEAMSGG